jgi:hypothetical protein
LGPHVDNRRLVPQIAAQAARAPVLRLRGPG